VLTALCSDPILLFDFAKLHLEKFEKTPGMSERNKALILGENAARLHRLEVSVTAEAGLS
jgi:hypothetical protein